MQNKIHLISSLNSSLEALTPDSAYYGELRNGKTYNMNPRRTMSENGSIKEEVAGNSSKNAEGEVREIHTLTQEEVNEQIKSFIAPSPVS